MHGWHVVLSCLRCPAKVDIRDSCNASLKLHQVEFKHIKHPVTCHPVGLSLDTLNRRCPSVNRGLNEYTNSKQRNP